MHQVLLRPEYLGSGIIISTAFVHLLSPAFEELKDPRLPEIWHNYDWAPVITMFAVFSICSYHNHSLLEVITDL
jgi:zinc transporter 1/2/3